MTSAVPANHTAGDSGETGRRPGRNMAPGRQTVPAGGAPGPANVSRLVRHQTMTDE